MENDRTCHHGYHDCKQCATAALPASLRLPWRLKQNGYCYEAIVGHHRLWCLTPETPPPYRAGYCGIIRYRDPLPTYPEWWKYNTKHDDVWGEQITDVSAESLMARLEQEFFERVPEARFSQRSNLFTRTLNPDDRDSLLSGR